MNNWLKPTLYKKRAYLQGADDVVLVIMTYRNDKIVTRETLRRHAVQIVDAFDNFKGNHPTLVSVVIK